MVDLSVIVPCHNLEEYISMLLYSLKSQKLGEYKVEYIFVLDACTDNTKAAILAAGLPNYKVIDVDYHSCGLARNKGMEYATGTYIWFMDGDDWLMDGNAIATALTRIINDNADIIRVQYSHEKYPYDYWSMVWQFVFKKSFIEEFEFDDKHPAEDDRYMLNVYAKLGIDPRTYRENLPFIKRPLYYYNYGREGSNMWCYLHNDNKPLD